jgi:hypothetical protein
VKVYQIEISNFCNLTCSYCPHPAQTRVKGNMTWPTFEKAIELLIRCGQRTAYLHNFGEPLLHPQIVDFVRHCTDRGVEASFFTNGVLLTGELLAGLADAGLRYLYVSEHARGEARRVGALIAEAGLPLEIRDRFRPQRDQLHTWAGQVAHGGRMLPVHASEGPGPCLFQRQEAAVVLWDGRISACCIDVEGQGALGTVDDYLANPGSYAFRPIGLCRGCTLMRGAEDLS